MAIGKPNRGSGKSFTLKLKLKDGDEFLECARFDIQQKVGDKYEVTGNTTDVNGNLVGVETRIGDFEGQPIHSFKLALRDKNDAGEDETYYVDASLGSGLGRGLANSILNLKAFDNVQLGLYPQTNKQTKKVYPAVSVRQGSADETVKWAYDPKDGVIPAPEEFKARGGKIEKDYTKQELFLLEKLKELGAKLGNEKPAAEKSKDEAGPAKATKTAKPAATESLDEDVPF